MREGDMVVFLADPNLYGQLVVCDFTPDGRLVVQDCAGETYTFDAHELELEERWAESQMADLSPESFA
jgi:hypothetical protein